MTLCAEAAPMGKLNQESDRCPEKTTPFVEGPSVRFIQTAMRPAQHFGALQKRSRVQLMDVAAHFDLLA